MNLHTAHPLGILERLLDDVRNPASRHYTRYGAFVSSEGQNLFSLLERCVRREVWELAARVQAKSQSNQVDMCSDFDAVKGLGGDMGYHGRAIYLHIVEFADGAVRLYVGQAFNLASRVNNQHADFRYRRDHPSLHNFAVDASTGDTYVVLAQLRETTQSDLVLNLLEMWMALCFRTLPGEVLDAWLGAAPNESRRRSGVREDEKKVFGLNVASPLDQGDKEAWKGAFQMLKGSRDAMAREYFWDTKKRPIPVVHAVVSVEQQGSVWTHYLPHFLAVVTLGFVVGRWSATAVRKN
jgi:hypothetical protein